MSRKVEVDQREVGDLNLQCFSFFYLSTTSINIKKVAKLITTSNNERRKYIVLM